MKYNRIGLKTMIFFVSILLVSNFAIALPPLDYGDITAPKFKSVDVVLETEWNVTERTDDVNVVEIKDNDKIFGITLVKKYTTMAEITLVKGVAIKIYDHESGKLLYTYKLEKS